jgi:hypothetical protein
MIVEIPSCNQHARQQLLDIIGRVPPSEGLELRGAATPRIEVAGYAFMDLWHTHAPPK